MKEVKKLYSAPIDRDVLLEKEIINGTFHLAVKQAMKCGVDVISRYESKKRDFDDVALRSGTLNPILFRSDIKNYGQEYIKEAAWLPVIEEIPDELDVLYNPKWYYDEVKRERITWSRDEIDCEGIAGYPYYESGSEGLYGIFKDDNGFFTGFFSLIDDSFSRVAYLPAAYENEQDRYVGYVEGALLFRYDKQNGYDLISVTFDGDVNVLSVPGGSDLYPLSHFGVIVIDDGTSVKAYDSRLNLIGSDIADRAILYRDVSSYAKPNKYNNGAKILGSLYYPATEKESVKFKVTKDNDGNIKNIIVTRVETPFWKYSKATKYYYTSDGFFRSDKIKLIDYNEILNNVESPVMKLPEGDEVYFQHADIYGDFIVVSIGGQRKVLHTMDFEKWDEIDDIYGGTNVNGRLFVKRQDGIAGFMGSPFHYMISRKSDVPQNNGTFEIDGYIFRRSKNE